MRKQLDLAFEGQSFPHPLVIGDLEIKGIQGNVRMLLSTYTLTRSLLRPVLAFLGRHEHSDVSSFLSFECTTPM